MKPTGWSLESYWSICNQTAGLQQDSHGSDQMGELPDQDGVQRRAHFEAVRLRVCQQLRIFLLLGLLPRRKKRTLYYLAF